MRNARARVAGSKLLMRRPLARVCERQCGTGGPGVFVLLVGRPVAIAVLEVDPQVLDRLASELGHDARIDLVVETEDVGTGGMLVEQCKGNGPPLAHGAGVEDVGRHVSRVDGLARGGVHGSGTGDGPRVNRTKQCIEPRGQPLGKRAARHGGSLSSDAMREVSRFGRRAGRSGVPRRVGSLLPVAPAGT